MAKTISLEIFQRTLDFYLRRWFLFLNIFPICIGISLYTVALLNRIGLIAMDLPLFLYPSQPPTVLYKLAAILGDSEWIYSLLFQSTIYGVISMGPVAMGVFSIGACSIGLVSIGACSIGLVSIGVGSIGLVSIGGCSVGLVSIARGTYGYGKAVGIIAISNAKAYGVYTLSRSCRGSYIFSLESQEAEAVALFTRWLPKFKKVFHSSA